MFHRLDRLEFKFMIPTSTRDEVIEEVVKHTGVDTEASQSGSYPIISQYYDNIQRDSYWEKQRKQHSRRKLRVRVYGSEGESIPPTTFIEVKHKQNGRGVKRRLRLSKEEALQLAEEGTIIPTSSRRDRMIVQEISDLIHKRNFKFLCTMRYDRQAFIGDAESPDLRVTFDTGIACRFEQLDLQANDQRFEHYIVPKDQCIMEVKTNTVIPIWLRNLIGDQGMTRQSYSKFCTALEKHDPVLRRTLFGHTPKTCNLPVHIS